MEIIILILSPILIYGLWRFGRWSNAAFDEMDEGLRRAQAARRKRDRAIEKLDDWLDRH